jgi:nucleotide-binding universal stress UspA family protein
MRHITHILCGIDFSDESRHALDHAVVLARWYNAALTGVYVYPPPMPAVPDEIDLASPSLAVWNEDERKECESRVQAFLDSANSLGISKSVHVVVDGAAEGILSTAKATGTDLLVMGTHGAGGFQRLILGSVAERVLRLAACPVMTVPPRARKTSALPFKRILCPIDFGDTSKAALELAASLASEGDADLTILHVLEPGADADPLPSRSFTVPEYHQFRHEEACAQLKALIDDEMREWCRPTTRIVRGKPYREILGVATEDSADLIVMGIRGRNPVDLALFGSTTNQVVRAATCPVLTLRA